MHPHQNRRQRRRPNYMVPDQATRGGARRGRDFWPLTEAQAYAALARFFTVSLGATVSAADVKAGALQESTDVTSADWEYRQLERLLEGQVIESGGYGARRKTYQREPLRGAFASRDIGSLDPPRGRGNKALPGYEFVLYALHGLEGESPVVGVSVGVPGMWFKSPTPDPVRGFRDETILEAIGAFFGGPGIYADIYDGANFKDDAEYDFAGEPGLEEVYGEDLEREGLTGSAEVDAKGGRQLGTFFLVRPYVADPDDPDETMSEDDNVLRVEFGWPQQFLSGGNDMDRAQSLLEWGERLRA